MGACSKRVRNHVAKGIVAVLSRGPWRSGDVPGHRERPPTLPPARGAKKVTGSGQDLVGFLEELREEDGLPNPREKKLADYGDAFLEVIRQNCRDRGLTMDVV
jgi:hypothetical protein